MVRLIFGLALMAAAVSFAASQLFSVTPSYAMSSPEGLPLSAETHGSGANSGGQKAFSSPITIVTSPSHAFLSIERMAPGDRVTAPISIRNEGAAGLRYSIASGAMDPGEAGLANQLGLTIKSDVETCTNEGFTRGGTILYGPGPLHGPKGMHLVGSSGRGRLLKRAAAETLCFSVTLPLETPNAFMDSAADVTFTFNAEQALGE